MWEGIVSFYNEFLLDYMNTASSLLARRLSSDFYMRSILHMQEWEERFLVHTTEYWIISHGHPLREFWDVFFLVWSNIGSCHLKSWIICLLSFFCAGTPQGVGPVKIGQKITAGITDLIDVHFNVEKRKRPGSCWASSHPI